MHISSACYHERNECTSCIFRGHPRDYRDYFKIRDNGPKIDFPCNSVAGYMKESTYHGGVFAGFISSLLLCFRVAKSIVDSLQIKLRKATSFLGWSLRNRQ